ncbi:MAG: serine acetyltransferase [Rhodobacteraceae bacterium]|nr:MAG: serine acetyltransferase [Paracoccaceae bacterium]
MGPSPTRREKAPPLPDGRLNMNPPDLTFWQLIAEDLRTHNRDILAQGFWILFWHRFGNWRMSVRFKPARMVLTAIYRTMYRVGQWTCGIKLPYTVQVGRRVKLEHFGGMILVPRCIGNDVTVRQNTTMGIASERDLNARPVLEDEVDIGAGAVLLGNCVIGRGSVIGANAVVTKSVEPYSVMVGVPAICIRTRHPAGSEQADHCAEPEPEAPLP